MEGEKRRIERKGIVFAKKEVKGNRNTNEK